MDQQLRTVLSTIYGEASASSVAAWKTIASVMINRVGHREWKKYTALIDIVTNTGFDAFTHQNKPFVEAWHYYGGSRPIPNMRLEDLEEDIYPLTAGLRSPVPDIILYYSPKAQAQLHASLPKTFPEKPHWTFDLLEEVQVPGTENDDFRWFKYKAVV